MYLYKLGETQENYSKKCKGANRFFLAGGAVGGKRYLTEKEDVQYNKKNKKITAAVAKGVGKGR